MGWPLILAAGIGATSSLGSSFLKNEWDREAANTAWEREREGAEIQHNYYMQRYQDTYNDMLKAGINPIMAASGGFNVGNSVSMPNVPMQHPASAPDLSSSAKMVGELIKMEDEKSVLQAQSMKLQEEAAEAFAKAAKSRAEAGLITAQERETLGRVNMQMMQFKKLTQETYHAVEQRELTRAEVARVKIAAQNALLEMSKLVKESNLYKGGYGTFLTYVRETLDALNIGGGFFMGRSSSTTTNKRGTP